MKFQLSIDTMDLARFVSTQMNNLFPDDKVVQASEVETVIAETLERVEACFSRIKTKYYSDGITTVFDHRHSDHYCSFLYLLGNTAYRYGNMQLATKSFLLNKALHGLDLYFSVQLPEVFLLVHPVGTVLGHANYGNFLVVYQNCTVGSVVKESKYVYPSIGNKVSLLARSCVLGNSEIGDNTTIGANCFVLNKKIEPNCVVTGTHPNLTVRSNKGTDSFYFRT